MQDFVCNASPLIFLAKIDMLDLLDHYTIHIPSRVETEILRGFVRKKEDAKYIVKYLKSRNIIPIKTTILKTLPDFLGSGEKAVISLAMKKDQECLYR